MTSLEAEMPRAKRLKMLREAKLRKERLERGEVVEEEQEAAAEKRADAITADAVVDDDAHKKADTQEDDSETLAVQQKATAEEPHHATDDDDHEDALNLAPKRANWDIERDIAPMMKKLEKRTQRAIVEILSTFQNTHAIALSS